jgi:hypothetical protein
MRRVDSFVADGRFVRRKVTLTVPKPWPAPGGGVVDRIQQFYVALRGQEWRIETSIPLRDVMDESGWSEALERFRGLLLGYEDWQNDWWLRRLRIRCRDARGGSFCAAGRR